MATIYIRRDTKLPNPKKADFYITPVDFCIQALRQVAKPAMWMNGQSRLILDPGAGSGSWGKAVDRVFDDYQIVGVDKRQVRKPALYDRWYPGDDYLTWSNGHKYDLICG